ncbi:IS110 family transposase [Mucilaginibacter paludis]|uniref:Transposase IS116/IS110/IS902 family protein n=1 Tax=Mucilaginibacter paludis DSM 18603 TaxID=714943 RepID=H1Y6G2_9SPHI|nr:IS110 family transposase [Mucilaginibacter paludis]EHQ25348.1 transposase IS116/IS110/IS902 family protein [Mucilaginibacter paludis DSM 18603]EHQ25806.1 transposase IS116/IS110/IS902 family protein [Mucilaginibacter paludis DSM 18603]EHQ26495.1 transposase IS116/IS110/IS902 family protein [Mucilaginibacter paludis DSM 18603]EHQ28933.1 transposase IS116/IS110/IS902 family protein [Mucilaginibacter paludis DSM 18603]EHQ30234.1 transposase IS116/IS110/IS902 family protein [Mucilaginibacter pa
MKTWNVVLGVDVSKKTVDICWSERKLFVHIDNNSEGFGKFKKWCKTNLIDLRETFIVLEYTGGYEYRFIQFCESQSIAYRRVPGLEIKQSMGMIRGKSDRADAFRIGQYGEDKIKRLEPSKLLDNKILELKTLLSFRKRLVRESAGYQSSVGERKHMYEVSNQDMIVRISNEKRDANSEYIKELESRIMELIKSNEQMYLNYRIITSIKGIGAVNGWMTIAYTENFTSFPDARHYAVYVGVIPFEHTSGTSKKGRRRTSNLAQKELKQELNQAAKTAMQHDPEIRAYAERKMQNKEYGLVLNNIKFKLILRMFSLVKRGEMYVENYRRSA